MSLPLKWHGGKSYLADWIIDHMPKHLHYVEPYGGGLAVLLAKDPFDDRHQWSEKGHERGISEVVNDLNGELMNFWKVLQDEDSFTDALPHRFGNGPILSYCLTWLVLNREMVSFQGFIRSGVLHES